MRCAGACSPLLNCAQNGRTGARGFRFQDFIIRLDYAVHKTGKGGNIIHSFGTPAGESEESKITRGGYARNGAKNKDEDENEGWDTEWMNK